MKFFQSLLLLMLAVVFVGCAGNPPSDDRIVGTWRWTHVGDRQALYPNYQTFDVKGRWTSWPTPWGEIQQSPYTFEDGVIRIGQGENKTSIVDAKIEGDELTFVVEDDGRSMLMRYSREPSMKKPGWLSPEDQERFTPRSGP